MMRGEIDRLMEQFDALPRPPMTTLAAAQTYSHTIEAQFDRIERYVDIVMKTMEDLLLGE
jgi:hypothetical protein